MDKIRVNLTYTTQDSEWTVVTFMPARPVVGDSITFISDQHTLYVRQVGWRTTSSKPPYEVEWEMMVTLGDE